VNAQSVRHRGKRIASDKLWINVVLSLFVSYPLAGWHQK